MSKKQTRRGGKYGDNHCTCIPLATVVTDELTKDDRVQRIFPDKITASRGKSGPRKHVKIGHISQNVILLAVTEGSQYQLFRVHVTCLQGGMELAARIARKAGLTISFQKPIE